jgi:hypothetical protein
MNKRFILILLGVAAIVAAICLIHPASGVLEQGRLRLGLSIAMCLLQLAASWFFFASLKEFKPGLRAAYILIAVGTFMVSVPVLIFAIVLAFNITADWLGAISALFYFSATLIVYLGVRRFARLLSIRSLWISPWLGLGLALAAAAAVSFVPGAPAGIAQLVAWSVSFSFAATMVAFRIRSLIGPSYIRAMNALVISLAFTAMAGFHEILVDTIWPNGLSWYTGYGVALWPYLLMMTFLLRAGLLFYYGARNLEMETNGTFTDAVTYAASLVSTPAAVDSTLDRVRVITSNMKPGVALTPEEKSVLVSVYLEIEKYLVTTEPLRKLTSERLRSHLTYDFQQALKTK